MPPSLTRRAAVRLAEQSRALARRLRHAAPRSDTGGSTSLPPGGDGADDRPTAFQEVFRELDSPDASTRERAAMLVGALAPPSAVRPLVRAYLHHGDPRLLASLRHYGPMTTLGVGRQALDSGRSPVERARLLDILGAGGDPAAATLAAAALPDLEPLVRAAAAAALLELGDARGGEALGRQLMSPRPIDRLLALRAAMRLEGPAVEPVLASHVERYLGFGGAVPREVSVALPMFIDFEAELPHVVAARLRQAGDRLSVVVGPAARGLAERQRPALASELPEHRLFFTTERHSPPEQFEVLLRARAAAATPSAPPVALVGELTSPQGIHPPPHFLRQDEGESLTVRIVLVGQQEFAVTMEWWYYIDDRAEVPTALDVVLTAHTLGAEDMTEEELAILGLVGEARREVFARALLAHRTNV